MSRLKSQTKVDLNAKLSGVDLQTIPYDGVTARAEGAPIIWATSGANKPVGGRTNGKEIVYINYVDTERNDVIDVQGSPGERDVPTLKLGDSGHVTGIRGNGVDVGLLAEVWATGALPSVGDGVFVDAVTGLWAAEAPAGGGFYYGIVERIAQDRAYFYFTSRSSAAA